MAKKKIEPLLITLERAARLYRILSFMGQGPQTRAGMIRRLKLGVRKFYRDLEILRKAGIRIELANGKYAMKEPLEKTLEHLPFPDPGLNLGEARLLAKGRTKAHKKIKEQLGKIEGG